MELRSNLKGLLRQWSQYRYVLLIAGLGLLLMLWPEKKSEPQPVISEPTENIMTVEEQLGAILSQVKGAGRVQVLLTQATGEEILYQTDEEHSSASGTVNSRIDTVTVTGENREEGGLVRQINPPTYQGAIVVCQGADDPVVRLSIVNAVSGVTGLGADKISVLKMG